MATKLKETDAVMVGMGWTGSILARELTKAGLNVIGLERGNDMKPSDAFAIPAIRDELRYTRRQELIQDPALETLTLRHSPAEVALPMRRFGAFLPGTGVGGAGNHWGGQHWRYLPSDHELRTHLTQRYGAKAIPGDMTIADWPMTYAELEPYYERFEKLCGVSGKAGNLNGRKIAGGNTFEGPRQSDYPNPPVKRSYSNLMFEAAANNLGYHPFPQPVSNASRPYTNTEGLTLGACQHCGFCDRAGCEANAKAGPHTTLLPVLRADPRFTMRAGAWVSRLLYDKQARKVTGVVYTDTASGEEYEQPATLVILSAYVFGNVSLLLNSGIGAAYDPATEQGVVGKNYCYQTHVDTTLFFEGKEFNPFMASPGNLTVIDDFNADNFDHSGLDFVGGAVIRAGNTTGQPISQRPVPPGTPRWGSEWKRATAKWYRASFNIGCEGSNYANRKNYLSLDPTYRDGLGRPLVRMTYNFVDNDTKMRRYIAQQVDRIAKSMNPTAIAGPRFDTGDFNVVPYQSTHNTGGTIAGADPKSSVVNRYLQSWDADNLFVMGASVFPQQVGYNPTGPVGALAYWAADAITTRYLKNPGPLVHA